jgi:uncharacterized protein
MIIVSDTTAISSLILINQIKILNELFGEVIIPHEVYLELKEGKFEINIDDVISQANFISVQNVTDRDAINKLLVELDIGEASAIILAKEKHATLLIIDERKGYAIATNYGLNCIGTLGILIEAYKKNLIQDFPQAIGDLKSKAKFWISRSVENRIFEILKDLK